MSGCEQSYGIAQPSELEKLEAILLMKPCKYCHTNIEQAMDGEVTCYLTCPEFLKWQERWTEIQEDKEIAGNMRSYWIHLADGADR